MPASIVRHMFHSAAGSPTVTQFMASGLSTIAPVRVVISGGEGFYARAGSVTARSARMAGTVNVVRC